MTTRRLALYAVTITIGCCIVVWLLALAAVPTDDELTRPTVRQECPYAPGTNGCR